MNIPELIGVEVLTPDGRGSILSLHPRRVIVLLNRIEYKQVMKGHRREEMHYSYEYKDVEIIKGQYCFNEERIKWQYTTLQPEIQEPINDLPVEVGQNMKNFMNNLELAKREAKIVGFESTKKLIKSTQYGFFIIDSNEPICPNDWVVDTNEADFIFQATEEYIRQQTF